LLAAGVIGGIAGYRTFAPAAWSPPPLADELERLTELLADEQVWSLLAEQDGDLVGQITVLPATLSGRPSDEEGPAHLRNLFVAEGCWGTGLATKLHAAGIAAARERGFSRMRLFSAAGQMRARRFYEREGWRVQGEEFFEPPLGLVIVEYRLAL
jgi:GNAT superfamily N-acetyltransferase